MTYTQPLLLLLLVTVVAALIRLRRSPRSRLPWLALTGLFLLSWPPFDWLAGLPLEAWYPVRAYPTGTADAIVVLSSDIRSSSFLHSYKLPDRETFERCEYAVWLYKSWKPLPILACGGGGRRGGRAFSFTMRELMTRAGVPLERIWTEERSRSTYENALFGAEILRRNGIRTIALVVDAQSMMRAAASFTRQGIGVLPTPSAFREFGSLTEEILPSWKAIERNENTLHELLALSWYRLRGRI